MNVKLENLVQRRDHTDEILAMLNGLGNSIGAKIDRIDIASIRRSIDQRLAIIEARIEELRRQPPIIPGPSDPNVITKEVTVFYKIEHEKGMVVTGWKYPDGAAKQPSHQYCYWSSGKLGGTSAEATIHIAVNGTPAAEHRERRAASVRRAPEVRLVERSRTVKYWVGDPTRAFSSLEIVDELRQ
jgi:hypothetical protein